MQEALRDNYKLIISVIKYKELDLIIVSSPSILSKLLIWTDCKKWDFQLD